MTTRHVVQAARTARARRRLTIHALLAVLVVVLFAVSLMVGQVCYPIDTVLRVIGGEPVPGAAFAVGELRLPRACLAALSGFAFGFAGATFQTLLRNPLASPDIIGVSSGASAAAVVAIVVAGLTGPVISLIALGGALAAAAAGYGLSMNGRFAATRLILVGIGLAAMLTSVISYALVRASEWDVAVALRWITGSLGDPSWDRVMPVAVAVVLIAPLMIVGSRDLAALGLGDDLAVGLGVRAERSRRLHLLGAVILLAFATAGAGPISFVAFMSGPIAVRLMGRAVGSPLLSAGLVGAGLVMAADLTAQFALPYRYPVGVVTGLLGAPFLVYLLIRVNRSGGSL